MVVQSELVTVRFRRKSNLYVSPIFSDLKAGEIKMKFDSSYDMIYNNEVNKLEIFNFPTEN